MLVIGHRGAAGLAPENTLEALQAGVEAGADMLEFDVRLTSDDVPVLSHDAKLHGMRVASTTLAVLRTHGPVTTLRDVLDRHFGRILLNMEIKPVHDVAIIYETLKSYVKTAEDWENIIVSSFFVRNLTALRRLSPELHLALLHSINPFAFVTYQRRLKLSAVGWHRLHVNKLATEIATRTGLFTYVYTVNRPEAAHRFEVRGIDGVVTDYPDRLSD